MTHVVVAADAVAEIGLDVLRATPGFEVIVTVGKPDRLAQALPRANALLVRSETQVTEALLTKAPLLRVVARAGIGVDNIDVAAATHRGIAVMNTPGANTVSAAEHAMALLLALVRRIPGAVESMRRGEWDRKRFGGTELRGKTMGVVGLGRIGAHVAGLARAFGLQVIGHDPFLPENRVRELHVDIIPLDALLQRSDVVTLHLPLTDDTRHLIDARRLAMMKPTAVLINTARGDLIDATALADALREKRLGGAALDVFAEEPLPADSPLRTLDRIILTPHLAASTAEAQERVAIEICTSVRDALEHGDIGGAVNVPGVSADALRRLRPLMDLGWRLGRLAAAVGGSRAYSLETHYGGSDDEAPKPLLLAVLQGILGAMGVHPVTLVNVLTLANERGIAIGRRVGPPVPGFDTSMAIVLRTETGTTTVSGALVADGVGRVIRIDDFPVDLVARGHVVVLRNRDVPGVIGRVGSILGEAAINIGSYHQSRGEGPAAGEALAAIAVDQPPPEPVLARLAELPDVLAVRHAFLDGGR